MVSKAVVGTRDGNITALISFFVFYYYTFNFLIKFVAFIPQLTSFIITFEGTMLLIFRSGKSIDFHLTIFSRTVEKYETLRNAVVKATRAQRKTSIDRVSNPSLLTASLNSPVRISSDLYSSFDVAFFVEREDIRLVFE